MNSKLGCLIVVLALSLSSMVIATGTRANTINEVTPVDDPDEHPLGYFRGILPNPHPNQTFDDAYEEVSGYTQFIPVWGKPSPFYNMSMDLEGPWGDIFVDDLIRGNGMFPIVHLSFFGNNMDLITPPSLPGATLNDPDWRQLYKESALDVVNASQPRYLSLGNEVNRWLDHHGSSTGDDNGFQHFISLYNETYQAVKELSPDTMVFCTFAREIVSENKIANMSFLENFDSTKLDLLVMTTYPFAVQGINRVSDILDDYYSSVFDHITEIPMGFSEAAWTSLSAFGGETEQSIFISNLTTRLTEDQGLDLKLLGWPWLHDIGPTDATGLKFNDGSEKMALETWKMNTEPTYDRNNRTVEFLEDTKEFRYDLNLTFSDPDAQDHLVYEIWNGTQYSNFTDRSIFRASIEDHFLVIDTYENGSGQVQLRIRVTDRCGATNWTLMLIDVVEVNDPPALLDGQTEIIIPEGSAPYIDLSLLVVDAEDLPSELNISLMEAPDLVVTLNMVPTPFMYIYARDTDWFGETFVLLKVKDSEGETAFINLTVIIEGVEDPPSLSLPIDLSFPEDSIFNVSTEGWWSDPDPGSDLLINLTASDPDKVSVSLDNTTMIIQPVKDHYGSFHIDILVSDGSFNVSGSIEVEITGVNDAPRIQKSSTLEMVEDKVLFYDLAPLDPHDVENETIFYTLEGSSDTIRSVSFPDNGTMKISPSTDSFGPGWFNISLRDRSGGVTHAEFNVEISSINDPPFLMTPNNWTVDLKRGDRYEMDLSSYPYISEDVDDSMENVTLVANSTWISVVGTWVTIDVPINWEGNVSVVGFYLEDPEGSRSEVRDLRIIIQKPLPPDSPDLLVENVTFEKSGKDIVVRIIGEPDQIIWAVIVKEDGTRSSHMVDENTASPGNYLKRITNIQDELLIEFDEEFTIYLSLEENGDNDSDLEPYTTYFEDPSEKKSNGSDNLPWAILVIIIIFMVLAVLWFMNVKYSSKDLPDEE